MGQSQIREELEPSLFNVDELSTTEIGAYNNAVSSFQDAMGLLRDEARNRFDALAAHGGDLNAFDHSLLPGLLKRSVDVLRSSMQEVSTRLVMPAQAGTTNELEEAALNFVNVMIKQFNDFLRIIEQKFPSDHYGELIDRVKDSILMNLDATLVVVIPEKNDGHETIQKQLDRIFTYFETFVQQALETLWFHEVADLDQENLEARTSPVADTLDLRTLRFYPTNAGRVPNEIVGTLEAVSARFQHFLEAKFDPHLRNLLAHNKDFFVALFDYLARTTLVRQSTPLFSPKERTEFGKMALELRHATDVGTYVENTVRDSNVMDMLNKIKYFVGQSVEHGDADAHAFFDNIKGDPAALAKIENLSILGGYKVYLTSTTRTAERAKDLIQQGYAAAVNSTHIKGYAFDLDRTYLAQLIDPDETPGFDISSSRLHVDKPERSLAEAMDAQAKQLMADAHLGLNVVVERGQCYHIATHPKAAAGVKALISGRTRTAVAQAVRVSADA